MRHRLASISVLDLESPVSVNDPHANLKQGFALAKQIVAAMLFRKVLPTVVHAQSPKPTT